MANDSPQQTRRREKLRALIGPDHGALAALEREIGTPRSHLSAILAGNRGIGPQLAAKFESHFGKPAGWLDEPDGARWPFAVDLYEKVLALSDEELAKAEGVLRAHLGLSPKQVSDPANKLQVIHGKTKQDAYAGSTEDGTTEFELPANNTKNGTQKHQRPARKTGSRHA